jgi:hypothetical protein
MNETKFTLRKFSFPVFFRNQLYSNILVFQILVENFYFRLYGLNIDEHVTNALVFEQPLY